MKKHVINKRKVNHLSNFRWTITLGVIKNLWIKYRKIRAGQAIIKLRSFTFDGRSTSNLGLIRFKK